MAKITLSSLIVEYKADLALLDDTIQEIEVYGSHDQSKINRREWMATTIADLESIVNTG